MLEGLNAIDWSLLEHAQGAAEDIPEVLYAIAAGRLTEDGRSPVRSLYSTIWHQGSVYESTAYAVPYLIELAVGQRVLPEYRAEVLELLGDIAHGESYLETHVEETDEAIAAFWRQEPDYEERLARERQWVQESRAAVLHGLSTYLSLMADEEPEVRVGACRLLGQLTEEAGTILPALTAAWEVEESTIIRGALILAFGRLSEPGEIEYPLLEAVLFDPKEPPVLRFAAATQLTRLAPVIALASATPILAEATADPTPLESDWNRIDHGATTVAILACECLAAL